MRSKKIVPELVAEWCTPTYFHWINCIKKSKISIMPGISLSQTSDLCCHVDTKFIFSENS